MAVRRVTGLTLSADIETILVFAFAGILAACITWGWRKITTLVKNSNIIHEQVMGRVESKQQPAIPSLNERFNTIGNRFDAQDIHLKQQDAKLKRLEHEVTENGGSSVKDAINRVETKLDKHMAEASDVES